MTPAEFESLLARSEGETLDFKQKTYTLGDLALVKDVVCMANTPRDEDSHIVLGVKKHPNNTYELYGVTTHPDDADLQGQFADRVYPVPDLEYRIVQYEGKEFGVIVIPAVRKGPCVATRDLGDQLHQWQVYFRRGSRNSPATPDDIRLILDWLGPNVAPRTAYVDESPAWQALVAALDGFERSTEYVLVSCLSSAQVADGVVALGTIPWSGVVDFDPEGDIDGLLAACRGELEAIRSIHTLTSLDRPTLNVRGSTYWFFARGLSGRQETVETGPWLTWRKTHGAGLGDYLRRLAAACAPAPTVCIALAYEPTLRRHLRSALEEAVSAFGSALRIVVATDNRIGLEDIAADLEADLFEIPLHQLCSGLAVLRMPDADFGEQESLMPSSSGAPQLLAAAERSWLQEELALVHLGAGVQPPNNEAMSMQFLRGGEISWYELGVKSDVDRDVTPRVRQQLQADLRARRTSRVNLYHAPGAGGTTVAKRLAWDLHREFPVCVLRTTNPADTVERLDRLTSLTGLSALVLVDGAEVTEKEADQLYNLLRSRQTPVVLLQVLRRFTPQTERPRAFYLRTELSRAEASRFAFVYARENPAKRIELEKLATAPDPRHRSAFYFGLSTYGAEFRGLEPYVEARVRDLTPEQRNVLAFSALAHHYAQRALPAQAFADLLGIVPTRPVSLAAALPGPVLDLLVQVEPGWWRTAHELVADELLQQVLWPQPGDRRLWKQNLSTWAIAFAEFCRGATPVPSEDMLEVARRAFIYRDNAELLGTERSGARHFAQLLEDVPSSEGAVRVLREVVRLFPDEAHFWAHLGRYHSVQRHEHAEAVVCIDRAIALDDTDSVLHHMRGMALRQQGYELIQQSAPLPEVLALTQDARSSFARARELSPDDEHGYISEAQMLARVADYAGRSHPDGLFGYLQTPDADPALRECLESAEDLLERVRRNREGEGPSPFEEECRARLDALYGRHERALEILGNIVDRKDIYAPPIRRQIIWTYLARRKRSWDHLDAREISRIASLLERNLEEEPNNEANLRLWVQAVRRLPRTPSIDSVIERVSYWRANTSALDASYYLYLLYALGAFEGSAFARESALRFLEECRTKARFRRDRTKSFEWYGSGEGLRKLVHHSELGDWIPATEFWERTGNLKRLSGRIVRIEGPQAGSIEVAGGLPAFFVPARGGFLRGRSENRLVTCYLGFSYDGLRAWEVRDADDDGR